MIIFKRFAFSTLVTVFVLVAVFGQVSAQSRARIVDNEPKTTNRETSRESQPVTRTPNPAGRPLLTNEIRVVSNPTPAPLVKKTASAAPTNSAGANSAVTAFNRSLFGSMQTKLGLVYRFGSTGPNSYDCSGLIWSVFSEAGLDFERTSARSYWQSFEPVYGDDRYKFGTLVFFNGLGHVGIMIDENTFYHASQSKGVTFSKLAGYWEKRIIGFRRIPLNNLETKGALK